MSFRTTWMISLYARIPRISTFRFTTLWTSSFTSSACGKYQTMATSTSSTPPRSYSDAIVALNTLQSNFNVLQEIRKSGGETSSQAIPEMIEFVRRIGYKPSDFNRMNIIHITGTKGKGSTCAFTSSILFQYLSSPGSPVGKIGMYTSPHLRAVRERIQINGASISEALFAKYFFSVWDHMEAVAQGLGNIPKPAYFRFLTLVAFHTFMEEGVDTAIIEVGIGGEYDSTNIIEQPTCVGITSLGLDHVGVLGATIEQVAWHKAGIIKKGRPAFTVPQVVSALEIIEKRAEEKKSKLEVVGVHPEISGNKVKLGLPAEYQKTNASLAVTIAAEHLRNLGVDVEFAVDKPLPEPFKKGLETVVWPGRCQVKHDGNIEWCIDGAHTTESLAVAGEWFAGRVNKDDNRQRVLIFNQQTREPTSLIHSLVTSLSTSLSTPLFHHAIFCTNITWKQRAHKIDFVSRKTNLTDVEELLVQKALEVAWKKETANQDGKTETHVLGTIENAVGVVRGLKGDVQVFVTGSLHLVGCVLEVLESEEEL